MHCVPAVGGLDSSRADAPSELVWEWKVTTGSPTRINQFRTSSKDMQIRILPALIAKLDLTIDPALPLHHLSLEEITPWLKPGRSTGIFQLTSSIPGGGGTPFTGPATWRRHVGSKLWFDMSTWKGKQRKCDKLGHSRMEERLRIEIKQRYDGDW